MAPAVARNHRPLEVIVRFLRTAVYERDGIAEHDMAMLDAGERAVLARLRRADARRDYLAAHLLARRVLGELAGCDPARICFRSSRWGRPETAAPRRARHLRFSLSHADGIALCAVAWNHALGADVESLRNIGPDVLGVADTICSEMEKRALRALPRSARKRQLLRTWVRKEAVAKAAGNGFRSPLTETTFLDDPTCRVASLDLTRRHVAAVAILGVRQSSRVRIRFEEQVRA